MKILLVVAQNPAISDLHYYLLIRLSISAAKWLITLVWCLKNPIQYWLDLRVEYPVLSQMALDILTIPGSSADCEWVFSEPGDLLEPRHLKMKPATISAIQCTRAWAKKGFKPRENSKWDREPSAEPAASLDEFSFGFKVGTSSLGNLIWGFNVYY